MAAEQDAYFTFQRPICSVAVIGAGLAGLIAAAHLCRAGCDVVIFERADTVGGAWVYSPEPDCDPPYPNTRPAASSWEVEAGGGGGGGGGNPTLSADEAASCFAPPGPVYTNMRGRGSTAVMQTSLLAWPRGTPDWMHHSAVAEYLRSLARTHGLEARIRFRTRVEAVEEDGESGEAGGDGPGGKWLVRTVRLIATNGDGTNDANDTRDTDDGRASPQRSSWTLEKQPPQRFDAVVVASGRYGAPRVPDIPGLAAWHRRWPQRVRHAKQYRSPAPYVGRTVLVVGAFISAMEIATELATHGAAHVYASGRSSPFDLRPKEDESGVVEVVPMVVEFVIDRDRDRDGDSSILEGDNDDASHIAGSVVLEGDRILAGIDHVILATGYLTSFPFLGPRRERPDTLMPPLPAEAGEDDEDGDMVVVAGDARTVYNLHEDIFYIPRPTLAFIGVSQFASTFALFDVQAQVLAAVWAADGGVRLPSQRTMRAEQRRRRQRLLPGTLLNSIFLCDDAVMRRLLDWANSQRAAASQPLLPGPHPGWWAAYKAEREKSRGWLGAFQDHYLGVT